MPTSLNTNLGCKFPSTPMDGTISPCYHDPYDNLLCQIFGAKFIRLFPPDSPGLYPHSEESLLSNSSQLDVENPDYSEFPEHRKAQPLDCVLERGEMLFIPKGWWHFVKSLTPSFSVSFWWHQNKYIDD